MITHNTHASPAHTTRVANAPILERVARRESRAFEDFIVQYQPLLAHLIRKSIGTGPRVQVEFDDAMQEVCLAIWETAHKFDVSRGSESTFVAMLTRRRLIDRYYRRRARIATNGIPSEAIDELADPRNVTDSRSLPEDARQALDELDPENRHLLELAVVHEKTMSEIAQTTGLLVNTVKTRIHRALSRVRASAGQKRAAA